MTARVADPGGLAATQSFTVTVASANVAPQITSTPVTSATVGGGLQLRRQRQRCQRRHLDLFADAGANGHDDQRQHRPDRLDADLGPDRRPGRDRTRGRSGRLAATQSFTVTVASANVAPQITSTPVTSATVGVAYSYDVNASDANGDMLSYSLTQAPPA